MKSTFKKNDQLLPKVNPVRLPAKAQTLFLLLVLGVFAASSCKKQQSVEMDSSSVISGAAVEGKNILLQYQGLQAQTLWELQQARASTARYRQIQNALRNGYKDINVVTPGMGHHFMKESLVDATFDFKNPEILVYNKHLDGSFELVAVEYAVPLTLLPNNPPEGFAGSSDEWNRNEGFGLWLLHAWVWAENPMGVFNPTNPLIHTH